MEGGIFRFAIAWIFLAQVFRGQCQSPPRTASNICPAAKILNPTIKAFRRFDARSDAKKLYKAIKGDGTDEQIIIDILTQRTYEQRNEIADVFYKKYRYRFRPWLLDEVSGVFWAVIKGLMYPPTQILADDLLWAVKGAGTNEQMLIDILIPINAKDLSKVKTLFGKKSELSLQAYVKSDTADSPTTGDFQGLLIALINNERPDDGCVNVTMAKSDALALADDLPSIQSYLVDVARCYVRHDSKTARECVKLKASLKSVSATVHDLLTSRSWIQLKKTFEMYKLMFGHDFDADISKDFDHWYSKALSSIYQYAMNPNLYFAQALERDVEWCQKEVSWGYAYGVARVFTWRSEIDLGDIAEAFKNEYKKTLSEQVKRYVSGYAKKALLEILK